jgi:prepilin-type N-terminal cleavage/methylation domain-containing protein
MKSPAAKHKGFTLVEVMIAIVVTAIIAAAAWTLAQVGTQTHVRELRRADVERTRRNVESTLGRSLQQTTRAGFSAPNLGMLRARESQSASGLPADTLTLLTMKDPALSVASRPCAGGTLPPQCISLRGDRGDDLQQGDLLAVGSSQVGYRLLQVTAVGEPYQAPCGADCPAATYCPVAASPAASVVEVLLGTHSGGGTAQTCSESFFPDGSRCVETRGVRSTTPRPRSVCSTNTGAATFTDVSTADRTDVAGFPQPREWTGISGGSAPAVAAVPVDIVRITTAAEGPEYALVMARGLTAGGAWTASRRLAGPIAAFRVDVQHVDDSAWRRGDGIDAATLTSFPNRTTNTTPAAGSPGFTYARGYHTLVAARIDIDVVGIDRDGARTLQRIRLLQSLAPLARGGAREEP